MSNGKSKGSGFEREISRKLTQWLTGQEKELAFWRAPGSGSVGTANPGTKELSGDIMALNPNAAKITDILSFELKTGYEGASFDLHLKCNKNEPLKAFWEQSVKDAKRADKEPVVIFRKKRMPNIWCAISENLFKKFYNGLKEKRIIMLTWGNDSLPAVIFMNLEDFLGVIHPELLIKL